MKKENKYFLEEDLGGGFGGNEGPQGEPTQSSTGAPASTTATIDPRAFAQEFGNVIGQHFKENNQRQAPAPRMSEEDMKKALNVWEPDDAFVQEFGNLETQKGAFAKFRDGLIRQADTIMQTRLYEMQQQFNQQLTPVQQMLQERQAEENIKAFGNKYPQLKDASLKPMIDGIANQLNAQGKFQGMNRDQIFDTVAQTAAQAIATVQPGFTLTGAGNSNGARPANSITPQSHGSGFGGSGNGDIDGNGQGVKRPAAASLFAKIRA